MSTFFMPLFYNQTCSFPLRIFQKQRLLQNCHGVVFGYRLWDLGGIF